MRIAFISYDVSWNYLTGTANAYIEFDTNGVFMYKRNKICAVVPAYNEEKYILKVINTMPKFVDHIVVVDDASTDNTYALASNCEDNRAVAIRHKVNQGVGGAIITGHKKALEMECDISVVMAGDAQMDPKYLPDLLDTVIEEGYHYTKGNRFLQRGSLDSMPKSRIFGNMILTFLTKLSSGYWNIFDPQNGYTAIKCDVLRLIDLDNIAKGFEFENDILIHLNIGNFRVKDVSIPSVYAGQKSHIKPYKFIPKTSALLLKGFIRRIYSKYVLRNFHPIALFLGFGILFLLIGFVSGLFIIYNSIGLPTASTGTVMFCTLTSLIGFQLFLAGVVLDIYETPK